MFKISGLSVPVHSGQFRLTLAYQFKEGIRKELEKLVNDIDLETCTNWELQIYSRDFTTAASKQVR